MQYKYFLTSKKKQQNKNFLNKKYYITQKRLKLKYLKIKFKWLERKLL